MAFNSIPTKARRDPLGFKLVNQFLENARHIDRLHLSEHAVDGTHNALVVHRGIAEVELSGGPTYTAAAALNVGACTRNGAGDISVALTSGKFATTTVMRAVPRDGSSKPRMATVEQVSATEVRVRIAELSSALGGGNTWAAVDASFSLFINCQPYEDSTDLPTEPVALVRGNNLAVDQFGQLLENIMVQRKVQLVGHSSAGVHAVREVSKGYVRPLWDGAAFSATNKSTSVSSINRVSAGILEINLGAGFATPMPVMLAPDFRRSTSPMGAPHEMYCLSAVTNSTSKVTVYTYEYDFGALAWARADCDFAAVIYSV